jgi:Predicted metal-dependent RNase, consists of a metallo-beta-lactamase domain and an RNA-binding KH domain
MRVGGNVIIPSFAVGRTQELLYFMREIKERKLVTSNPNFDVYVDSPLAGEATKIYAGDLRGYLDAEALDLVQHGDHLFTFPGLHLTQSSMESRALNEDPSPKVIISASGMCDAGRIRHHLKHNLWRRECIIVFVGYQAVGSLGRLLLDGATAVKLFGEEIKVQAKVIKFDGLSSHADRDHLLQWITHFTPKPKQIFVVHGDENVTEIYAQSLRDLSLSAHAPDPGEVYDLATNRILEHGTVPVRKKPVPLALSLTYQALEAAGERLLAVIRQNKGGSNKDLKKFTEQIEKLIDHWKR